MVIARKQTLVQLSDELIERLDARAARDRKSRSALIREAIEAHLGPEWDEDVARQYREAYTRIPQTEDELDDWSAFAPADSRRPLGEDEEAPDESR